MGNSLDAVMEQESSSAWQACGASHVAVYGTLREGGSNDIQRFQPRIACMGRTWLPGSLWDMGQWPGLQLDGSGQVLAEVYPLHAALEQQLDQVHSGEIDVLVGTQMVAKGHDFRRITLVAAVQPDGALFSSDFRAPERLFCLLMQAAGRAGRDGSYVAAQDSRPEMWVQTQDPEHMVFQALRHHDYPRFAQRQLQERRDAGMPPFAFQALVRADAKTQDVAQGFLRAASEAAQQGQLPHLQDVFRYPPIPMAMQRVADVERAQMLIEATDRRALQRFLHAWQPWLHWLRGQPAHKGLVRWIVDVDPQSL